LDYIILFGLLVNGVCTVIGTGRIVEAVRQAQATTRIGTETIINVNRDCIAAVSKQHAGLTHAVEQALAALQAPRKPGRKPKAKAAVVAEPEVTP
jgi:hypothetical protein